MKKRFKIILSFFIFTLFLGIPQNVFLLKASENDLESINKKFIEKSFYILGPGDLININIGKKDKNFARLLTNVTYFIFSIPWKYHKGDR